jgi:hypothetical protein
LGKINTGHFDEELADCANPLGSNAYSIIKERLYSGTSPTEQALARKARKAVKFQKAILAEQQQKSEQILQEEKMSEEAKKLEEAREAELLGAMNRLALDIPSFAFATEDLLLAQHKFFDVIWIKDSIKLTAKMEFYKSILACDGVLLYC